MATKTAPNTSKKTATPAARSHRTSAAATKRAKVPTSTPAHRTSAAAPAKGPTPAKRFDTLADHLGGTIPAAKKLQCSIATVSRIRNRKQTPGRDLAVRIERIAKSQRGIKIALTAGDWGR